MVQHPPDQPAPNNTHYGLHLWPRNASPKQKFRRVLFAIFSLIALLCVSGPLMAPVAGPQPLVLGFPFSMTWVLGWLFLMYGALFVYHRTENR
jgi:hypothetical protein